MYFKAEMSVGFQNLLHECEETGVLNICFWSVSLGTAVWDKMQ